MLNVASELFHLRAELSQLSDRLTQLENYGQPVTCDLVEILWPGGGFRLGKYPVTNEEYSKFLVATGHREPKEWNNVWFNQPRQPVVGVSWDDAQAFCQWCGFRLPTEAEWEYACRAGTTTEYSFGDDETRLAEYGWFSKNSGRQTPSVGKKKPNPWGLFDMHGNVWEWCSDGEATNRVIRGGCWAGGARSCRSASRYRFSPENRDFDLGFRLAADLKESE